MSTQDTAEGMQVSREHLLGMAIKVKVCIGLGPGCIKVLYHDDNRCAWATVKDAYVTHDNLLILDSRIDESDVRPTPNISKQAIGADGPT